MSVIEIREAQRENARLVIGLASVSGEGKTYSAIQLGYGLANFNAKKLGVLDTENRRGSLYADILTKSTKPTNERFLIGDLHPPFSPQRYIDAITEFEKAGVEVLIIDSVTHEWEGTGGCGEIAEAGNPKIPNWSYAKKEHKRFMNKLLQCDMHIIVCVRAREKTKPEKDERGKIEFVEKGLQPIQEKNFMFEMTGSLMLHEKGMRQQNLKVPDDLLGILGREKGYLTSDDGQALRKYVDGAVIKVDPAVEKFRNRLLSNTEGGLKHIEDCWAKTPEAIRKALGETFHSTLQSSAKAYDDLQKLTVETTDQGDAPEKGRLVSVNETEKAEAAALAARARQNGAQAPMQRQTAAEPPAQAVPPKQAAPKPQPTKQPELEPPVTGVLDSDPVF